MILRTYKIKTKYTKIGKLRKDGTRGDNVEYSRLKTVHDIKCDSCENEFTESRDSCRIINGKKQMCPECRTSNNIGVIFRQHRKNKEDKSKIGQRRMHQNTKYPEIYVGIDSWHTKVQGHWCREHIYVMEEHLGYKIPDGYVVHHIDGDKCNNHIENLALLTISEHNNAHAKSETLIFDLVKKGMVKFNTVTKLYEFS